MTPFSEICSLNGSFHSRFVLCSLYFEKYCDEKYCLHVISLFFRIIRVCIVQGVYHVEIAPESLSLDGILTLRLPHPYNIIVHGKSVLGENATIFQNVTIGSTEKPNHSLPPKIGNHVYIGANACILGDIEIGNNVKIGAQSVILKSITEGRTICGLYK